MKKADMKLPLSTLYSDALIVWIADGIVLVSFFDGKGYNPSCTDLRLQIAYA